MASYRKAKLNDNSAFLQFNWKADVVESWIGMYKFCVTFMVTIILGEGWAVEVKLKHNYQSGRVSGREDTKRGKMPPLAYVK